MKMLPTDTDHRSDFCNLLIKLAVPTSVIWISVNGTRILILSYILTLRVVPLLRCLDFLQESSAALNTPVIETLSQIPCVYNIQKKG